MWSTCCNHLYVSNKICSLPIDFKKSCYKICALSFTFWTPLDLPTTNLTPHFEPHVKNKVAPPKSYLFQRRKDTHIIDMKQNDCVYFRARHLSPRPWQLVTLFLIQQLAIIMQMQVCGHCRFNYCIMWI